jgi:hypothetical protein
MELGHATRRYLVVSGNHWHQLTPQAAISKSNVCFFSVLIGLRAPEMPRDVNNAYPCGMGLRR